MKIDKSCAEARRILEWAEEFGITVEDPEAQDYIKLRGSYGSITISSDDSGQVKIETKVPSYEKACRKILVEAVHPDLREMIAPPAKDVSQPPTTSPVRVARGFRKAERRKAKLRLGITGPAGSGKTMSALLIASGLTNNWNKIGIVDTENGSGDLYVNKQIGPFQIGEYQILTMHAPFEVQKYIDAIKLAEDGDIEVLILDSISHAWAGIGGLLEVHGKLAPRD